MSAKQNLINSILNSYDGEEIDWGTASPRPTIRPGSGQSGGWVTNPKGGIIGRGGKPVPVGDKKKPKKPKGFAR